MRRFANHYRSLLSVAVLILACAAPALGQSTRFEVSAFVEPGASYNTNQGFDLATGFGAGFGWRYASHWTAEMSALIHDARLAESETYQAGLRYSFGAGDARWRPFAVAGLHHRETVLRREIVCVTGPCPPQESSYQDTGLFVGGGIDWQLAERWTLRLEGRRQVINAVKTSDPTNDLDDNLNLTAGVAFRF